MIAEKDKVYEEFPTPLINRLEKHFVVTSTILDNAQKELLAELEAWTRRYACIRSVSISLCDCVYTLPVQIVFRNFKVGDAFVGYQEDTSAAVVLQVTHLLKDEKRNDEKSFHLWKMKVTCITQYLHNLVILG